MYAVDFTLPVVLGCGGATAASAAQAVFACIVGGRLRDWSRNLVKISILRVGEKELPSPERVVLWILSERVVLRVVLENYQTT